MAYGYCLISIPRDHQLGQLESPKWYRLQFRFDPELHVTLLEASLASRDQVLAEIDGEAGSVATGDAFVFVHGFNVTFEDAARRTAQLAYDVGFDGPAAFFSWPSKATLSPLAYTQDEQTAEWAAPHLAAFLERIAAQPHVRRIFILAHSMGARVLSYALVHGDGMPQRLNGKVYEVILAAPDIDSQVFIEQFAVKLSRLGRGTTLYSSTEDVALAASKKFNGHPRVGDSGKDLVIVQGIDTIDASKADSDLIGHSYYGNGGVIGDLRSLIVNGQRPPRTDLMPRSRSGRTYWELLPRP